jgi:hypothetical protein
MRAPSLVSVILAVTAFSAAASAAAPPDSVLFAGYITSNTVNPNSDGTWCMTDAASSSFLHSASPLATLMSFSEVIYTTAGSVGPTAYRLSGQARLVFGTGSTTAGKIVFDANNYYPTTVYFLRFTSYAQNYNTATHTLTVQFNILFPGCTLPISAVYRN